MQDDKLVTVLLGYIDCCITSKNIMPTFYYAVIMINTLTQAPNHTENIGVSYKLRILLLNVYMIATLVKWNSTYSCHLEMNDSLYIGPV